MPDLVVLGRRSGILGLLPKAKSNRKEGTCHNTGARAIGQYPGSARQYGQSMTDPRFLDILPTHRCRE